MASSPIVIVGAGGFGREVLDVVEAINASGSPRSSSQSFQFLGYLDDGEPNSSLLIRRAATHLGPVNEATLPVEAEYVIAVSDPTDRRKAAAAMERKGYQPAVLVHPAATLGGDVELGPGSVVCSHVSVTTNVRLGRHVQLHVNSTVGHDARLGDEVTVLPGAAVSGAVTLEPGVTIGTGAVVIQGLSVGAGSFVGAGAAVVSDVSPGVVVVGVPARVLRDTNS